MPDQPARPRRHLQVAVLWALAALVRRGLLLQPPAVSRDVDLRRYEAALARIAR
jgi:hypothetical protein